MWATRIFALHLSHSYPHLFDMPSYPTLMSFIRFSFGLCPIFLFSLLHARLFDYLVVILLLSTRPNRLGLFFLSHRLRYSKISYSFLIPFDQVTWCTPFTFLRLSFLFLCKNSNYEIKSWFTPPSALQVEDHSFYTTAIGGVGWSG